MNSEDNKVYMKRLNPHSVKKGKGMSFFPKRNKFYNLIQEEEISNSFCQSIEQQKMGKMQLPNTIMSLTSGKHQNMKVIMSTHIMSYYFL
jgi:hypothetical protein